MVGLDKSAVATGCWQERKRTSVKISDMGHRGVRAGQRTTVRKHFVAELKELESLWVFTKGALSVYDWGFMCVCELYKDRGRKTEWRLWALHGIALTKH